MSILSTVLKVIGLETTQVAVAKELDIVDPDDEKIEDILKSNEKPINVELESRKLF